MLETKRLRLREFTDEDFARVHDYGSDPEVVQFMVWGPNTEQDTRDFLQRAQERAVAEPREVYELAVSRRDDDLLLGAAGIYLKADGHLAELGYCYHRDAWGQGYATEAAEALLELAFDVLLVHRVYAGCDPDNTASARVLQKVGMQLEGHLREDSVLRGEPRDSLIFGILKREWLARESS